MQVVLNDSCRLFLGLRIPIILVKKGVTSGRFGCVVECHPSGLPVHLDSYSNRFGWVP